MGVSTALSGHAIDREEGQSWQHTHMRSPVGRGSSERSPVDLFAIESKIGQHSKAPPLCRRRAAAVAPPIQPSTAAEMVEISSVPEVWGAESGDVV